MKQNNKIFKKSISVLAAVVLLGSTSISAYSDPQTIQAEPSISTRTIIGNDDRVQVNPRLYPYSPISLLRVTFPNGKRFKATGFLIAPDVVATVAHTLYSKENGGLASSVEVIPAADGKYEPFGTARSIEIAVPEEFKRDTSYLDRLPFDYGAIRLNSRIGEKTGTLKLYPGDSINLQDKKLTISGYPGEKNTTMWTQTGNIDWDLKNETLAYGLDITAGNSGSPIYDENGWVYGIHAASTYDDNRGVKINNKVYGFYTAFMNNHHKPQEVTADKLDGKEVFIQLKGSQNMILDKAPDNKVVLWNKHGGKNQHWILKYNENKKNYQIVSAENPNRVLTYNNLNSELYITDNHNAPTQFWTLEKSGNTNSYIIKNDEGKAISANSTNHGTKLYADGSQNSLFEIQLIQYGR